MNRISKDHSDVCLADATDPHGRRPSAAMVRWFLRAALATLLLPIGASFAATPEIEYSDAYMASGDGTRLQVQVWRPTGNTAVQPAPVLLMVTPYSGLRGPGLPTEQPEIVNGAWARGWTFVEVALRGYGRSEGCGDLLGPNEVSDVMAAVDWAAQQPWSDGRVVMSGWSYDAWTVLAAAAHRAPILAGVALAAPSSLYTALYEDGVATGPESPASVEGVPAGEFSGRTAVPFGYRLLVSASRADPPPSSFAAFPTCFSEDVLSLHNGANPDSPYSRARDLGARLAQAEVPMLFMHGFQDRNVLGQDLGGWIYYGGAKAATFSHIDHNAPVRGSAAEDALDWLQAHLDGHPPVRPPVVVQDSLGYWRAEAQYPPADVATFALPVRAGQIVDAPDLGPFAIRPEHMALTLTPPFKGRIRLAGQIDIDLDYVAPPLAEFPDPGLRPRVIAWVYDVNPEGLARFMTRGAAALNLHGQVSLDTEFTDWVIEPGHRLLLVLSGTDVTAYEKTSGQARTSSYAVLGGHWRLPVLSQPRTVLLDDGRATPVTALERVQTDLAQLLRYEIATALPQCQTCGGDNAQPLQPLATLLDSTVNIGAAGALGVAGPAGVLSVPFTVPAGLGPIVLHAVAEPALPTNLILRLYQITAGGETQLMKTLNTSRSIAGGVGNHWRWGPAPEEPLLGPGDYRLEITNQYGGATAARAVVEVYPATPAPAPTQPTVTDANNPESTGSGGSMEGRVIVLLMLLWLLRSRPDARTARRASTQITRAVGDSFRVRGGRVAGVVLAVALAACQSTETPTTSASADAGDWPRCVHPYPCGNEGPAGNDFEIGEVVHFPVVSHDGVTLDGYVHLPNVSSGVRVPVVLHSTPYPGTCAANGILGNASNPARYCSPPGNDPATTTRIDTTRMVQHGFAVAHMSVRGTGLSGGCFSFGGLAEQQDQVVLVDALANAAWSNGRVAMIGHSYPSYTAWSAAVRSPPALKTVITSGQMTNLYTFYHTPQGALSPGGLQFHALYVTSLGLPPLGGTPPTQFREPTNIRVCPDADPATVIARELGTDARDATFWSDRILVDEFPRVSAAVLIVSGFEDSDNTLSLHSTQDDTLWEALSAPKRGLWGHWGHDLPPPPAQLREDWHDDILFPWLDFWLKGLGDPQRLQLGTVSYQDAVSTTWPPREARQEALYLGKASLVPSPTGESHALMPLSMSDPLFDLFSTSGCHNTFVTAPVAEDVLMAGNPFALLQLESDQAGGVVLLRLVDLPPGSDCDSEGTLITNAAADLRFFEGNFIGRPFPTGQPVPVRVDFFNQSWRLAKDHRLALVVESPMGFHAPTMPYAPNLILHGEGPVPSHLVLPIVEGSLGGQATGFAYPARPFALR